MPENLIIPLDVPGCSRHKYVESYLKITRNSGRLMLFAGDQKVEHLNDDFYGPKIDPQDNSPDHLFNIAAKSRIGVFATQLGLIARYGMDYPEVPYLVKINSKTNLVKTSQVDPISSQWFEIQQIVDFRDDSGLDILGIGYTVYLGSEKEDLMLSQAARLVYEAHRAGLVTVLWMYPRGKAVKDEMDPHLVAGATGVAAALGSDFAKVNYPNLAGGQNSAKIFREAVQAAGRTGVICAGGPIQNVRSFLQQLHNQIHVSGVAGNATGRNIHQKSLDEAIRMCNAIYAITIENAGVEEAFKIYSGD
jgi:fructose-bisphosphate aldolase / 6-deoxy-5-ketofructose 1-phosphate synthase